MNPYEQKKEARIARMRASADRKAAEGAAKVASAHRVLDNIPLGQPILVGHHSEARHRRDIARSHGKLANGFALADEAKALDRRADAAEAATAVSSDDPEAIEKLREKLAASESDLRQIVEARAERPHYTPAYAVTNMRANVLRLKKRIAELEAKATAPAKAPERIGDVEIAEAENRVRVTFPGKPAPETIATLKARGFRWSPSAGAWQRHASNQAWFWAREIAKGVGQ